MKSCLKAIASLILLAIVGLVTIGVAAATCQIPDSSAPSAAAPPEPTPAVLTPTAPAGTPSPVPRPTKTPAVTPTPTTPPSATPTASPQPTPSPTPTPTATATRTATPQSCLTTAEAQYVETLVGEVAALAAARTALTDLAVLGRNNTAQILQSGQFHAVFVRHRPTLQAAAQNIIDLALPTSRLRAIDTEAFLAANKTLNGTAAIAEGIETAYTPRIYHGVQLLREVKDHLLRVKLEIRRVCK